MRGAQYRVVNNPSAVGGLCMHLHPPLAAHAAELSHMRTSLTSFWQGPPLSNVGRVQTAAAVNDDQMWVTQNMANQRESISHENWQIWKMVHEDNAQYSK
ncbi:hypothetical protein V2G26_020570 [Clonostachys chloroleuca]